MITFVYYLENKKHIELICFNLRNNPMNMWPFHNYWSWVYVEVKSYNVVIGLVLEYDHIQSYGYVSIVLSD